VDSHGKASELECKGPVVVWNGLVIGVRGWLWAGAGYSARQIARDVLRKVTSRVWIRRGG
jgi:hypothetical protein